jgi:hypothetical protein
MMKLGRISTTIVGLVALVAAEGGARGPSGRTNVLGARTHKGVDGDKGGKHVTPSSRGQPSAQPVKAKQSGKSTH